MTKQTSVDTTKAAQDEPTFGCSCKICGRDYLSKCQDSRVCPNCRMGKRS